MFLVRATPGDRDRRPTTDDRRPTTDDRRPTTDDRRPRPTTDDAWFSSWFGVWFWRLVLVLGFWL
jgi:hypothetical protein